MARTTTINRVGELLGLCVGVNLGRMLGRKLGESVGVLLGDRAIAWRIDRDNRRSIQRSSARYIPRDDRWAIAR